MRDLRLTTRVLQTRSERISAPLLDPTDAGGTDSFRLIGILGDIIVGGCQALLYAPNFYMKFSQRIGQTSVRTALQVGEIDNLLKNRLWNTITDNFLNKLRTHYQSYGKSQKAQACEVLWKEFFGLMFDEIPSYHGGGVYIDGVVRHLKQWYLQAKWYEVYDLVEFIVTLDEILRIGFADNCNRALEKEQSGYRIIDSKVVQITSEQEIQEIEKALSIDHKWQPCYYSP